MKQFERFGFYTLDDIFEIAKEAFINDTDKLNRVIDQLRNKDEVIDITISKQEVTYTDDSPVPEISVVLENKKFVKINDDLYTDNMVHFHISNAKALGMSLIDYLTDLKSKLPDPETEQQNFEKYKKDENINEIIEDRPKGE